MDFEDGGMGDRVCRFFADLQEIVEPSLKEETIKILDGFVNKWDTQLWPEDVHQLRALVAADYDSGKSGREQEMLDMCRWGYLRLLRDDLTRFGKAVEQYKKKYMHSHASKSIDKAAAEKVESKIVRFFRHNPTAMSPAKQKSLFLLPTETSNPLMEKIETQRSVTGMDLNETKGGYFVCANCAKGGLTVKLQKCGGCKTVRYCSPECSKAMWSRHKGTCKEYQAMRDAAARDPFMKAATDEADDLRKWSTMMEPVLQFVGPSLFNSYNDFSRPRRMVIIVTLRWNPNGDGFKRFDIVESTPMSHHVMVAHGYPREELNRPQAIFRDKNPNLFAAGMFMLTTTAGHRYGFSCLISAIEMKKKPFDKNWLAAVKDPLSVDFPYRMG